MLRACRGHNSSWLLFLPIALLLAIGNELLCSCQEAGEDLLDGFFHFPELSILHRESVVCGTALFNVSAVPHYANYSYLIVSNL